MEYDITSSDLQNLYKNLKTKPRDIPILQPGTNKKVVSTAAPATTTSAAKAKTTQPKKKYHVIVSGDTLYKLAGKYDTKVSEICRLNGIKETDILQIGVKLRVK